MERETQFVGESGAFLDAVEMASRAAALERPVLVIGERGTGKELIAERLHRLSQRWEGPLITLNCAALPETLIEAELFGHEAGAFTGATRARAGAFEEADGGTLFLDELATLSQAAQERLLRAVEYGEVTRIGSNSPLKVDVRIVGATNENLPSLVERNRFRADLLDRLSFEVVTLPPLRVRDGDILVLADYFGRRMAVELDWPGWPGFGDEAVKILIGHDWPGNVRELRNVVERSVYRWERPDDPIDSIQLDPFESPWRIPDEPPRASEAPGEAPQPAAPAPAKPVVGDFKAAVEQYEKEILETALERARYNQRQTAKALGLTYDQLRHALKRHDMIG
ncbi:phage shock protein operon transcriptional activator [Parasphingopyxis sp.]|uniref:phage shock protein operon transcriptional activator n=1 Tax=Parasphingopyxis sp. TaxID=1920299 RepID=UPI002626E110|nr:phage shock protein operon transcriptional activator [Parasphingopyxis sp.]